MTDGLSGVVCICVQAYCMFFLNLVMMITFVVAPDGHHYTFVQVYAMINM